MHNVRRAVRGCARQAESAEPGGGLATPHPAHSLQFDPLLTIRTKAPTSKSHAVCLPGMDGKLCLPFAVTFCLNNTLRHSRPAEPRVDDLSSPALTAPATKPKAGIIGVAEERFGLRKSPTAPMELCQPNGGWFGPSNRCGVDVGLCHGQKRRASQAARSIYGLKSAKAFGRNTPPTHPRLERPTTQIPREGDAAL